MQLELVAVFLVLLLWCSGDRRAGALLVGGIALLDDGTAAGCSGQGSTQGPFFLDPDS